MKRGVSGRLAVAAVCVLVARAITICGAPALDVSVGLGGRVVPGRPTLVRLTVTDPLGEAARLQIVESVGEAGEKRAVLSIEAPADLPEIAVPIVVGKSALRVELLSADGRVLATSETDLAAAGDQTPFPVWVGTFSAPRVDRAVAVLAGDLPRDASSYAAAHSVWIGRPRDRIDAVRWDALARWTLSGGSLVLFTGSDAFLLDAPRWRDLLPMANVELRDLADGTRALTGTLRRDAEVLRWKDGVPWIVAGRYGMGNVLLVSTDAHSLDREAVAEIAGLVTPARAVSLEQASADLLDRQPIDHPEPLVALLLAFLGAAAIAAIAARRQDRPAATLVAVGAFVILAVGSALYTRPPRAGCDLYQTDAELSVFGSLGVSTTWSAVFSASPEPEVATLQMGQVPSELAPRGYGSASPVAYSLAGVASAGLVHGERRLFVASAAAPIGLRAAMDGDEIIHLTNRLGRRIVDAFVLIDGRAFSIPAIEPGETSILLASDVAGARRLGGPLEDWLAAVARDGALDRGSWLIAGEVVDERRESEDGRTRVRSVRLYVVEVERG